MKFWIRSATILRGWVSLALIRNDAVPAGVWLHVERESGDTFVTLHVWRLFVNVDWGRP